MKKTTLTKLAFVPILAVPVMLGACNKSSGTITTITVWTYEGTGTKEDPTWIAAAAERFASKVAGKSYEAGKTGVQFEFNSEKTLKYDALGSDATDIFVDEKFVDTTAYGKDYMMDLTDVVIPLKEAGILDEEALYRSYNDETKQYNSLPHYEWFTGVSYDIDYFNENNFFFADSSASSKTTYKSQLTKNDYYFVTDTDPAISLKSVGPDGVRNTSDDGLPSSMEEYIVLCEKIRLQGDDPFILCGSGTQYSFYLVDALWASLAGADSMRNIYCNWTGKEVELVKRNENNNLLFTEEELFFTGSGMKKPVTEKVVLNDTNGYRMYDMAARYYALCFFNLIAKAPTGTGTSLFNTPWLRTGPTTEDAKTAQDYFILQDQNQSFGMLYDSSYWYHEDKSTMDLWKKTHAGKERNLSHMPLPVQLEGNVTEGKGKKQTLMDTGSTYIFANKKTENNPGRTTAVKEFLTFLYTSEELNNFSDYTGLTARANYKRTTTKVDPYYKNLATLRSESDVVAYSSNTHRFKYNMRSFNISFGSALNSVAGNAEGYLNNIRTYGHTGRSIFEATVTNKTTWDKMA